MMVMAIDPEQSTAASIERCLRKLADPERVPVLQRFFRTGPGEYGEGDVFLGLRVPELRKLCREVRGTLVGGAVALLRSPQIVGAHLADRDHSLLTRRAGSPLLWERRIAIIATFHFIRRGQFEDTLRIATLLIADEHDLIPKAVDWMLREVGKRDRACAERFLVRHYRRMPRTMLRYAVEKFEPERRRMYLNGTV
jgi:hypothetical protein